MRVAIRVAKDVATGEEVVAPLPYDIGRGMTEKLLGSLVPSQNRSAGVGGESRIRRSGNYF